MKKNRIFIGNGVFLYTLQPITFSPTHLIVIEIGNDIPTHVMLSPAIMIELVDNTTM